ncbi:MAG: beta-phosphoglucomutase [Rikenellaceae bacterium]|nr:beta-phosphoglucomutase [Rikenellaceae bacterium]
MMTACLFDLDGVIVDTARFHYKAWRRLASRLGFDFTEDDNERLKGVSRMRSLDILLDVGGMSERFTDSEKQELADLKNGWYLEYVAAMTSADVLPGAVGLLTDLRRHGIATALASSSRNAGVILQRTGIATLFDAVVDGNDITRAKPDPQVFLLAASRLDAEPGGCVVFEDAGAGIEAASAAGMRSVGIGAADRLPGADVVLPGLAGVDYGCLKGLFV